MNQDAFTDALIQRIAKVESMLTRERGRTRFYRLSRDKWKHRAVTAEHSWRELPRLRLKVARLERALERERFLNSMSRMNEKRREMAA